MMGAYAAMMRDTTPASPPTPPEGDPSSTSAYFYGGSLVGLQWVNGDAAAYTEIGLSGAPGTEPSSVTDIVAPGVTSYETGTTTETHWWVRHKRDGIAGNWVIVPGPE